MPDERIARALVALDQAIAAAPDRDGAAFSDAATQVGAVRDAVAVRDGRDTADKRQRLTMLNAILSMILSGHFPLGNPPWEEIKKARGWLADLQPTL